MAKIHRRIGMPIATELSLRASGLDVEADTVSPAKLPDVYAGAPVTILGRYRGRAGASATLDVTGTTLGEPLAVTIARTDQPAASALAPSWARARIRDLEDRYASGSRGLESEIVTTSKRFGVLSRFTAFLAVDRSVVVNAGGRLVQTIQPVDAPSGWGGGPPPRRSAELAPLAMAAMPMAMPAQVAMPAVAAPLGAPPIIHASSDADSRRPAGPPPPPRISMATARGIAHSVYKKTQDSSADLSPLDTPDISAYLASLADLARELEGSAGDARSVRVLRQRLVEWLEDVRSVGGTQLAQAVEVVVARLGAQDTDAVRAVARELAVIAGQPTPAPPPARRVAFWK